MADRALTAAERLDEEGLSVEVIELRWLRPLDLDTIGESTSRTGRLLVVEEQVHAGGRGATVISELCQRGAPPARLAALSLPDDLLVPYSPTLEDTIIPSVDVVSGHMRHVLRAD
jgi:acetoin:2,6-dichlorophenolindophenol oxidoreductase subunit beta